MRRGITFVDQFVDHIGINTFNRCFLQFLLQLTNKVVVYRRVHHQYIITLFVGALDKSILFGRVVGVQVNQSIVLIGLGGFYFLFVFVQSIKLFLGVGQQGKVFSFIVKLLFAYHTVFYKQADIAPFFFERFTIRFKQV